MKAKAKARREDCCPLLPLVAARAKAGDRAGLYRDTVFGFGAKPIKATERYVVRYRRGKRGEPFAETTFALVNFCPFCGTARE